MHAREVTGGREFVARFEYGADWREEIAAFAAARDVEAGWFSATGAVEDAALAHYDQDAFDYVTVEYDEPLEVVACTGTVALDAPGDDADVDDEAGAWEPTVHAHATLSRPSGQTVSGALVSATVFDGELYCRAFDAALERETDPGSDRRLWDATPERPDDGLDDGE